MKLKIVMVDFEIPPNVKKWGLRLGIPAAIVLSGGAVAYAAGLVTWTTGQTLTAADLNNNFSLLQSEIAGTADCPSGYSPQGSGAAPIVCTNGASDEVVKVGTGPSSFWIDRYEASVWDSATSPSMQYGATSDDYPNSFPDTGQWTSALYAISKAGVAPSANITWFQANAACRASGKRMVRGSEWFAAAQGTVDPGATGVAPACNVSGGGASMTGVDTSCVSAWGAMDMIGNLREWTDDWFAGLGNATTNANPWPATGVSGSYNGDGTSNISASENPGGGGGAVVGLPAAAVRGGNSSQGATSGIFSLALDLAPSYWGGGLGFRCVLTR